MERHNASRERLLKKVRFVEGVTEASWTIATDLGLDEAAKAKLFLWRRGARWALDQLREKA